MDYNDFSVNEGAFWHTNMDLYYGYQPGEVVEVQHESNKYWLATIQYSYRHLVLLKWIGEYGEFWIDTSTQNSATISSSSYNEYANPKRLFPPGHHLQSQLKSQFNLEKPTKVLTKPSLYNPANDPYAEIKTVEDLLAYEADNTDESLVNQSSITSRESASLALTKCKAKITFGQEYVDELEAALQNLNDINENENGHISPLPNLGVETKLNENILKDDPLIVSNQSEFPEHETNKKLDINETLKPPFKEEDSHETFKEQESNDEAHIELCRALQESALKKGRYVGLNENSSKIYYLKPKQFFDIGGANQERVFVPGTLMEVCHSIEGDNGLELHHWFAIITKNVGGRLRLRWFLCDDPKFKQGRLEMKTCRSQYVHEDFDDNSGDDNDENGSDSNFSDKISIGDMTFCMYFCNPRIHSISSSKQNRAYKMPQKILSFLEASKELNSNEIQSIQQAQIDFVLDYRRMNLDKDRIIIDHILSTARWMRPQYVNLSFAPLDHKSRRQVLISCPKMTKLLKGFVKKELEPGVFEVHSEPISESKEIIKFIYPYDSSYAILPTDWAVNNQDCLSVQPSRNPTPIPSEKLNNEPKLEIDPKSTTVDANNVTTNENYVNLDQTRQLKSKIDISPYTLLCEIKKATILESDIADIVDDYNSNSELKSDLVQTSAKSRQFDEQEPDCWSRLFRAQELQATEFSCTLNTGAERSFVSRFKVMDLLEVVHPCSDITICLGRIRKVVYPLLWIQISAYSYTVLPFNSTDIYSTKWCETNDHPLMSLLPPRKRLNHSNHDNEKRKRKKICEDREIVREFEDFSVNENEKEHFDLGSLTEKQFDINYILNEKSMYIRIYFNHKCFTGPSLSKGKICSLPQYVGPGPLRLVMEEVVTKVISVAYVPPRILNDLSSKSFEDLLITRNLTNTAPMEFKAKYQKRVHKEDIPVCLSPDDVALYCECVCEHLKCCYNLFGPNLYDGDDCPGHCRALTKSNKFMKRATYYREKARLGEFINDSSTNKKQASSNPTSKNPKARYAGRDSSGSTCSTMSRSEQVNSRASSASDEVPTNEFKENLVTVKEADTETDQVGEAKPNPEEDNCNEKLLSYSNECEQGPAKTFCHDNDQNIIEAQVKTYKHPNESEFKVLDNLESDPRDWSPTEVADHLGQCDLEHFKWHIVVEDIDGQALLLLDKAAIREHLQQQNKTSYTSEDVNKFCRFVEFVRFKVDSLSQ